MIFVDAPDSSVQQLPRSIGLHRPDVFARSRSADHEIIGEAKTPTDLDSTRSKQQLGVYLASAAESKNRALLLATTWDYVRYANSLLKFLCKKVDISIPNYAVLDQFGNVMIRSNGWI